MNTDDLRTLRKALPTADVFVRDRADPSSPERNITTRVTGTDPYDIKDLDVSYDGKLLIFAMRGPLRMKHAAAGSAKLGHLGVHLRDRHPCAA